VTGKKLRPMIMLTMAFVLAAGYTENTAKAASDSRFTGKNQGLFSRQQLLVNSQQQNSVIDRLKKNNRQMNQIKRNISDKQSELQESQTKSEVLNEQITQLNGKIKMRDQLLKNRLRSIYINGGAKSYLDVFLGAESFGDFVDRIFALKQIADTDKNILNAQKKDKKDIASKQEALKMEMIYLKNNLTALKKSENELLQKHKDQSKELVLLTQEAARIKEKEMNKREESDIAEAQMRSSKNKNIASAVTNVSLHKSDFIRPTQGYLSSGFGNRSFDNGFHPGIDIANSEGTPVRAAADGVVFRAYQSSSYGNTVMISHQIGGKLYTTVYAHLSNYQVATGQRVVQGQVIGGMGNTGESFGSHLHFELYNGSWTPPPHNGAVNPESYIQ
jgi:murein DD-endopeptidase MepM/ murein hydrolase activator NlpD